jgi:hypothetical protein
MPSEKWRKLSEPKKHDGDLAFLVEVMAADAVKLAEIDKRYRGKNAPLWKRICIDRAMYRAGLISTPQPARVERRLRAMEGSDAEGLKIGLARDALERLGHGSRVG